MDTQPSPTPPRPRALDGFTVPGRQSTSAQESATTAAAQPSTTQASNPSSIDMSLPPMPSDTKRGLFKRRRKPGTDRLARRHRRKKIIVISLLVLLALVLAAGGYIGWKVLSNASKVFRGNVLSAVTSVVTPEKPLKMDAHGNTNVLLLGTSESDPNHPGAQLTDSMMIVSFNKQNKSAFLMSIPRDLWVTYAAPCSAGYAGKINAAYECALNNADGSSDGNELEAEKTVGSIVSKVTGMDIQYVAHLNLAVVQKVVDAVGGVDITIDSSDPRGILDRNFDWRCRYKCYLVKYPNGPAHLDGEHAMWLAQARNDSGGYGLPRGNFDREANQRKILIAVEQKVLSIGFLANPLNVTNLLDALGSNVHTTIDTSEIKSFISAAKTVPAANITPIDILEDGHSVLTTGAGPDGSSIVRPVAGIYDYSGLQAFAAQLTNGRAGIIHEAATIDVLNGSGVPGAAATEATTLQSSGYQIGTVDSAPDSFSGTAKYTLYDLSKGAKPQTLTALKQSLNVSKVSTALPAGVTSSSDFVVILGGKETAVAQ